MGESMRKHSYSYSQVRRYVGCQQSYEYGYVQDLELADKPKALSVGSLFHVGMEAALRAKEDLRSDNGYLLDCANEAIAKSEHYTIENGALAYALCGYAIHDLDLSSGRWETQRDVLGEPMIEYEFVLPLNSREEFIGYIDWVVRDRETGGVFIWDWKTRKTFRSASSEHMETQLAVYQYALRELGILNIRGSVTAQVKNKLQTPPKLLNSGALSKAKPSCTWDMYRDTVIVQGLDVDDYADMEAKCGTWVDLVYCYRSDLEVTSIWEQMVEPAIAGMRGMLAMEVNVPIRNRGQHCTYCTYEPLCSGEVAGYDCSDLYKKKERRK